MDTRARLVEWLQNEFAAEQRAGFPRLKRIPDTRVIRFLDHFATLSPVKQAELTAVLADWASHQFSATPLPTATYEQFVRATATPGMAEGLRYMGMPLLAGLAKGAEHGGLEGWFRMRGATGLGMQPPEWLLPNVAALVPVKVSTMRRLVKKAFARLFAPSLTEIGSGIWRYEGTMAGSALRILVGFSAAMGPPQFRYAVEVRGKGWVIVAPNFCFESVLGVGFGWWDYLTEENAARSVDLLCELVEYLARLPERLPAACGNEPEARIELEERG